MQRYNGKQLYEDDFHLQEQVINPHILAPSLIYSYTVNMEAKECISQKISQIKSVAYNKIKNGELETIPYTNIEMNPSSWTKNQFGGFSYEGKGRRP